MNKFKYKGNELNIFKYASNWKDYYFLLCKIYIGKKDNVLEVGAGIGTLTKLFLENLIVENWTALEPDKYNFSQLKKILLQIEKLAKFEIINSSIEDYLKTSKKYSIMIIADVLEHIKDDKSILLKLTKILKKNGKIIIFVPANMLLYSKFDKNIGHHRRYSKKELIKIVPPNMKIYDFKFIDSVGFFASLLNKFLINSGEPSLKQILFWDRYLIKLSKMIDKILNYKFGKNIFMLIKRIN